MKIRQVLKAVDVEGVTLRLLRDVMASDSRFETVDRRWAASVRFGDNRRPFERVLQDIIISAGVPLGIEKMAGELAQVYDRPAEYYEQVAAQDAGGQRKVLQDRRLSTAWQVGF